MLGWFILFKLLGIAVKQWNRTHRVMFIGLFVALPGAVDAIARSAYGLWITQFSNLRAV